LNFSNLTFSPSICCSLATRKGEHMFCVCFYINLWSKVIYIIIFLSCWDFSYHNVYCHAISNIGNFSMNTSAPSWFHNVLT
jgi:hypothetical protein